MAPDPEAAWIRGFRRIAGELSSEAKAELCSLATSALESAKEDLRKALEEEHFYQVSQYAYELYELNRLIKMVCVYK